MFLSLMYHETYPNNKGSCVPNLDQFRSGILPLALEIGRFRSVPEDDRFGVN